MFANLCLEQIRLLHAYRTPYGLSAFEEDKSRHRADIILGCNRAVLVYIDFDDVGLFAYTVLHFLKDRALHTAWA